jgi:lambda family phage portal protein
MSLRDAMRTVIRASIDNAESVRNARHWSRSTGAGPDTVFDANTRKRVRENARYETANNAYARGAVDGYVGDLVGTGPRLQIVAGDSDSAAEFAAELEADWKRWCSEVNFVDTLTTLSESEIVSGECFAVLRYDEGVKSDVKLAVDLVEADRVASNRIFGRPPSDSSVIEVDGIQIDRASGRPIAYRILRDHPGELNHGFSASTQKDDLVSADQVIHWYKASRPGQTRGISRLTPALELFALLRRYTLSVVEAAETAASWAGVLKTDSPASGEADEIDPLDVIDLEHRALLTLPAGWEMQQVDARQPTSTYEMFKRELLTEIGRALHMPANVISGDSSDYNYASGRLDHQSYHKRIKTERERIERVVLRRVFERFFFEWRRLRYPGVDVADFEARFMWDGFGHVDPVKEANAQATRLGSGSTTLADECAADGRDWEQTLRQRGREIKLMRELGIPIDGGSGGSDDDGDDDGKEGSKENNRENQHS